MTVIAYKNGVMAADSRAYSGSSSAIGKKAKLRRTADGTLVGCSSNQPGVTEAVMEWFGAGADPDAAPKVDQPSFALLAVRPDGKAFIADDRFLLSGPIEADCYAIGSGGPVANGAMIAGASAIEAVSIACSLDAWSASPIYSMTHDGDAQWH